MNGGQILCIPWHKNNKAFKLKKNRYDVPVPVCFKEFLATYYHICSNIYGIKSFILNNPILYVFLCVK